LQLQQGSDEDGSSVSVSVDAHQVASFGIEAEDGGRAPGHAFVHLDFDDRMRRSKVAKLIGA
jgi:hypothetical protein